MKTMSTAELSSTLLQMALAPGDYQEFLRQALSLLCESLPARYAAVVRAERGGLQVLSASGLVQPLPETLAADVLDSHLPRSREGWHAGWLGTVGEASELLLLYQPGSGPSESEWETVTAGFAAAWRSIRERDYHRLRLERLEALVELTSQWSRTRQMDVLLKNMAEAATRLLQSERASIFLWDKRNRQLIARPALGVEGEELRLADDRGVVGQVVQTGTACRVGAQDEDAPIDRSVDRQLRFRTRSLLCVPLFGKGGDILGAFEMINKRGGDFTVDDEVALRELAAHAAVALENSREYEQLLRSRNQITDEAAAGVQLIGRCPAIEALRSTLQRLAPTDLAVLIHGENGTGKEIVGRLIHYLSPRRHEPLIAVNCAAIPETLLESELFGHEKGAFTDARERRAGKFELASGGTLLLDEIGDLSLGGQAKLLRVLEEKIITRVGGSTPIYTDVRVIAATNQPLASMVAQRKFREDLFFRLNVVALELPPLRERGEDLLLLADHFLQLFSAKAGRRTLTLHPAARQRLLAHHWPGNVRELRNLMERVAYLSSGDEVTVGDLVFVGSTRSVADEVLDSGLPLSEATRRFQMDYVQRQIERCQGNMTEAAERLGLHRANLYRKMRQLGMEVTGD